jgi:integrase
MRNANGQGTIKKLSGKRRKPYAVYVTQGLRKREDGSYVQNQKYMESFATLKEANKYLAELNSNPYDLANINITFAEIYDHLLSTKYEREDKKKREKYPEDDKRRYARSSYLASRISAYKYCEPIQETRIRNIRFFDLQRIFDENDSLSNSTKNNIKILMNEVFEYAIKIGIISSNPLTSVEVAVSEKSDVAPPFTREEIKTLWKAFDKGIENVDIVLIQCYIGCRPAEFYNLKSEHIDFEKGIINLPGTKTKNAKRVIPIHPKIEDMLRQRVRKNPYFIVGAVSDAANYRYLWNKVMQSCNITGKTPKAVRNTFATYAKACGMELYARQKILGHESGNLTEDVYTTADIDYLKAEMNKYEI